MGSKNQHQKQEKKLVKELDSLLLHSVSSKRDQILLRDAIASKSNQLKILNDSIPLLLKKISFAKTLPKICSIKHASIPRHERHGIGPCDFERNCRASQR
mgnify:CR=1 FL=1